MTAQEWLDELERLGDAATPGPWINPGRAYVAQPSGGAAGQQRAGREK